MAHTLSSKGAVSPPSSLDHSSPARRTPVALSLLVALRPGQWTKNLLVFAGLIFGRRLGSGTAFFQATATFVVFCGLSGVVYLVNDVFDRESDRRHPLKAQRPIASGALPVATALAAAGLIGGLGLVGAFAIGWRVGATAVAYLALMLLYSRPLKHIVIVDVLTIAAGFVLRAVAGAVAITVPISQWLLVCTVLLALFIALAKRRHELVLLAGNAMTHRPSLSEYSPYLLDQMIAVVTASTLIAYVLYTMSPEPMPRFRSDGLELTIPFPLYGIFRYLYLVHRRDGGGSPADLLITDRPLLICIALWALTVIGILYRPFGRWF